MKTSASAIIQCHEALVSNVILEAKEG